MRNANKNNFEWKKKKKIALIVTWSKIKNLSDQKSVKHYSVPVSEIETIELPINIKHSVSDHQLWWLQSKPTTCPKCGDYQCKIESNDYI